MPESKICKVCGRSFEWRRKWADCWDEVRSCSSGCRKRGLRPSDTLLETTILELLHERGAGKTICPSEAARAIWKDEEQWRARMEDARMAARRLVAAGKIVITQKGKVTDPDRVRGAIRLRLK